MQDIVKDSVAYELNIKPFQVDAVLKLLSEGSTVPFIARYRKEATGGLDEEIIHSINKLYEYRVNLENRKADVIRLIDEKGMLSDDLVQKINKCSKLIEVEDIYQPFKEKKNTLASVAKKRGLEPLSILIMKQGIDNILLEAKKYINEEVEDEIAAIEGAKHIIAESISDMSEIRKYIRKQAFDFGFIKTKVKKNAKDERKVYEMYYEFTDKVKTIKDYRVLAINRAEKEKVINVNIVINKDKMCSYIENKVVNNLSSPSVVYIKEAVSDAYSRLLFPSIERDIRAELKERSEESAIKVFSSNLEQLLMQPPIKGKRILGLDPAYRTGCKLAVVNEYGDLQKVDKIFLHNLDENVILKLYKEFKFEIVAIGNGTASRESEEMVASLISKYDLPIQYIIVNEAGASVYSASKLARDEFPNLEVEERSAVSIARRLQDPLAELVKIDSKSVGVGQYQHDVNNKLLSKELDFVVLKVVNDVGVDVNNASEAILEHISGISSKIAKNIVKYRRENGVFENREVLKQVPYLGDKAFEQSAGFLRIVEGSDLFDQTSIHPESYDLARNILKDYNLDIKNLREDSFKKSVSKIDVDLAVTKYNTDIYTVEGIVSSLLSPLRDPREEMDRPVLKKGVLKITDLTLDMELEGTVRNIVDFGAFVDIGLKNDGLVHISKLSESYVKHPMDVVKVGEIVKVKICGIDIEKDKVSLSMI